MIERQFLCPDDMWKRVENGELLYVPVVTVHGTDHAHVYIAGQMAREPTGEIVGKGDMRAQIRKVCENIGKGLAHAGATFDDVVRATTYVTDIQEYYRSSAVRFEYFRRNRPASVLIEIVRLGHPDAMVEIEVEAIIEPERLKKSARTSV
jgi:enamine deaminase RidA (YjgF/YER057c/UK114 family)